MLGDAELIERIESSESVPYDLQGVSGATVEADLRPEFHVQSAFVLVTVRSRS